MVSTFDWFVPVTCPCPFGLVTTNFGLCFCSDRIQGSRREQKHHASSTGLNSPAFCKPGSHFSRPTAPFALVHHRTRWLDIIILLVILLLQYIVLRAVLSLQVPSLRHYEAITANFTCFSRCPMRPELHGEPSSNNDS